MRSKVGKDAMSVETFRVLMRQAWTSPSCFYAVLYLSTAWVLMSRSSTVASLLYDHISWRNDALVVVVIPFHEVIWCSCHRYFSIKETRLGTKPKTWNMPLRTQASPKSVRFWHWECISSEFLTSGVKYLQTKITVRHSPIGCRLLFKGLTRDL